MDRRYEALRAHVEATGALSGLKGPELLAALNAFAAEVPAPMTFTDLIALVGTTLSPASFVAIWKHPRFDKFYADVMGQNSYAVANLYPTAFAADGTLSPAEAAALAEYASRTVPGGPTVAELITGWGQAVTIHDLAAIGKDK